MAKMKLGPALVAQMLDSITVAAAGGWLDLYSGAMPSSPLQAPGSARLARLTFDTPPAPPVGQSSIWRARAHAYSAEGNGTATWARAVAEGGRVLLDIELSPLAITKNGVVAVDPLEIALPG